MYRHTSSATGQENLHSNAARLRRTRTSRTPRPSRKTIGAHLPAPGGGESKPCKRREWERATLHFDTVHRDFKRESCDYRRGPQTLGFEKVIMLTVAAMAAPAPACTNPSHTDTNTANNNNNNGTTIHHQQQQLSPSTTASRAPSPTTIKPPSPRCPRPARRSTPPGSPPRWPRLGSCPRRSSSTGRGTDTPEWRWPPRLARPPTPATDEQEPGAIAGQNQSGRLVDTPIKIVLHSWPRASKQSLIPI